MSLNMSPLQVDTSILSMQAIDWNIDEKSPTSTERDDLSNRVTESVQAPFECFLCLEEEDYEHGPLVPLHNDANGLKHPVHKTCFHKIHAIYASCPFCKVPFSPPPSPSRSFCCC